MKRFAIIAALTAGLFWNTSIASAQYRPHTAGNPTMSGRTPTMSGRLQTNHNHLTPLPALRNSPQYYSGGSGGMFFPGYPTGGYSNGSSSPPMWNGPAYPSGGYGSMYGRSGWWNYGG